MVILIVSGGAIALWVSNEGSERGLVEEEICRREVRDRMRSNLHRFYELNIPLDRSQQSYIDEMQNLAKELGLPTLGNDGRWLQ